MNSFLYGNSFVCILIINCLNKENFDNVKIFYSNYGNYMYYLNVVFLLWRKFW